MPPIWDTDGTFILNSTRSQSWVRRKFLTESVFTSLKAALSSFLSPTKFVPWSHLNSRTLPLRLMSRLSALINASVSIEFKTSKCIAREQRQVKIRTQRLSSFQPSLMCQGPKTSIPEYVKGAAGVISSSWRFAIFWTWAGPTELATDGTLSEMAGNRGASVYNPITGLSECVVGHTTALMMFFLTVILSDQKFSYVTLLRHNNRVLYFKC